MSTLITDQNFEFDDNKLTNLDSISIDRDSGSYNELANKKYVDDSMGEKTILR